MMKWLRFGHSVSSHGGTTEVFVLCACIFLCASHSATALAGPERPEGSIMAGHFQKCLHGVSCAPWLPCCGAWKFSAMNIFKHHSKVVGVHSKMRMVRLCRHLRLPLHCHAAVSELICSRVTTWNLYIYLSGQNRNVKVPEASHLLYHISFSFAHSLCDRDLVWILYLSASIAVGLRC